MGTTACLLVMLGCLGGAPQLAQQSPTVFQTVDVVQQDPRDTPVTLSLDDADVRDALKRVFRIADVQYTIAPEVQGVVTVLLNNVPFETALRNILDQVKATYRVEYGIYEILSRERSAAPGPFNGGPGLTHVEYMKMPEFRPGACSASYEVRNKALFLTANRTWGGTSDLLAQAADGAGFQDWSAYTCGSGFAFVLPVEAVQGDGRPLSGANRFRYRPNMKELDFRKVAEIVHGVTGSSAHAYRVLVLVVSPDTIKPEGRPAGNDVRRAQGNWGLPDYLRSRKWTADPKLTVLVYEFHLKSGSAEPVLSKAGEPGINARAHLIYAGLWKASVLR